MLARGALTKANEATQRDIVSLLHKQGAVVFAQGMPIVLLQEILANMFTSQ